MSKNYDNWEKLVEAVLRREQLKQLALCDSIRTPSSNLSSPSSSFNSQITESFDQQSLQLFAANWDRFLPPDDRQIISTTDYLIFFLDQRTGKKCYMLGARELKIAWAAGDTPQYWKWTPHADSRFAEVAQLEYVWWLDIRGKIKTRLLSPKTCYAAFLVFKLAERSHGLDVANAMIRFIDDESDKVAEKRAHVVHLQSVDDVEGQRAVNRADGWMEIEMGNFYYDEGDEGEVEVRLLEITGRVKGGLIVEGFEFRPTYEETSFISKKKQVRERNTNRRRGFSVLRMKKRD